MSDFSTIAIGHDNPDVSKVSYSAIFAFESAK